MAWMSTSTPAKASSGISWEALARLEEASPGLTNLPPLRLMATISEDLLRHMTNTESIRFSIYEYFRTVTPAQLDADLKASNFDHYQGIGELVVIPPEDYVKGFSVEVVCVL